MAHFMNSSKARGMKVMERTGKRVAVTGATRRVNTSMERTMLQKMSTQGWKDFSFTGILHPQFLG